MNPIIGSKFPMMSPFQRIGQVVKDVRMLQQNPTQMGKYLQDHGIVSPTQLSEIQNMNPSQIGQYLVNNGVMPMNDTQKAYQNIVPMIQNKL